jgi:hypothetical protein
LFFFKIYFYLFARNSEPSNPQFWKPYVDLLPEQYGDPLWMSDEQLEVLQGTNVCTAIPQIRQQVLDDYNHIISHLEKSPEIFSRQVLTLDRFLWAHSATVSRRFPVLSSEDQSKFSPENVHFTLNLETQPVLREIFHDSQAMVPFLDIANHSHTAKVTWIQNAQGMGLQIRYNLASGEEL